MQLSLLGQMNIHAPAKMLIMFETRLGPWDLRLNKFSKRPISNVTYQITSI